MSEVTLTHEQWERILSLRGKLKAKKDKVKDKDLTKLTKAQLIELVKELS